LEKAAIFRWTGKRGGRDNSFPRSVHRPPERNQEKSGNKQFRISQGGAGLREGFLRGQFYSFGRGMSFQTATSRWRECRGAGVTSMKGGSQFAVLRKD